MKRNGVFTGIAVAMLALAMAGGLAACGDGGPSSAGSGSGTDPEPTTIYEGTPLIFFLDDGNVAKLREDMEAGRMPVEVNVLYDAMGTRPEVVIDDPGQIEEVYRLFSQMLVPEGGEGLPVTDSYHHVIFTLQDGTTVSFPFEGEQTCVFGNESIAVSDLGGLWPYVRALQDEKLEVSSEARHRITIAYGEELIEDCPSSAAAGELVTITTCFVADGKVVLGVSGAAGDWTSENTYAFTMPDNDVEIDAIVSTAGYPGA